jgi:hypothetical protein
MRLDLGDEDFDFRISSSKSASELRGMFFRCKKTNITQDKMNGRRHFLWCGPRLKKNRWAPFYKERIGSPRVSETPKETLKRRQARHSR